MFFRATTAMHLEQAAEVACWDPCGLFVSGGLRREKRYPLGSPESTLNSEEGDPGG